MLWLPLRRQDAAFTVDLEKMMGTFQESADLALTSPQTYPNLFAFVSEAADQKDRENWTSLTATTPSPNPTPAQMQQRAEIYQRLRQASLRKLDAFQTFTSMRWVNKQQFWANIIGTTVLLAAFTISNIELSDWPLAAVFSVLGGMLAPVAKDIVVALHQVRQPRP